MLCWFRECDGVTHSVFLLSTGFGNNTELATLPFLLTQGAAIVKNIFSSGIILYHCLNIFCCSPPVSHFCMLFA